MSILTITEAAKLAGVDRRTLQRQIARGIISTTTRPDGTRGIDTSELFRLYHAAHAAPLPQDTPRDMSQDATWQSEIAPRSAALLQAELRAAQDKIAILEQRIAELQQDKAWFQAQWESLQQRLLPSPKKPWLERLAEALAKFRKPQG